MFISITDQEFSDLYTETYDDSQDAVVAANEAFIEFQKQHPGVINSNEGMEFISKLFAGFTAFGQLKMLQYIRDNFDA